MRSSILFLVFNQLHLSQLCLWPQTRRHSIQYHLNFPMHCKISVPFKVGLNQSYNISNEKSHPSVNASQVSLEQHKVLNGCFLSKSMAGKTRVEEGSEKKSSFSVFNFLLTLGGVRIIHLHSTHLHVSLSLPSALAPRNGIWSKTKPKSKQTRQISMWTLQCGSVIDTVYRVAHTSLLLSVPCSESFACGFCYATYTRPSLGFHLRFLLLSCVMETL